MARLALAVFVNVDAQAPQDDLYRRLSGMKARFGIVSLKPGDMTGDWS